MLESQYTPGHIWLPHSSQPATWTDALSQHVVQSTQDGYGGYVASLGTHTI